MRDSFTSHFRRDREAAFDEKLTKFMMKKKFTPTTLRMSSIRAANLGNALLFKRTLKERR